MSRLFLAGKRDPWSPWRIPRSVLRAWWNANHSGLITGPAVSSWKDSLNAYDAAQATGAAQPAYSATSFNGRPGITFDGTADYLDLTPLPAGIPMGTTPFEISAAVSQDAVATDTSTQVVVSWGGASNYIMLQRVVVGGVNRARASVGISAVANNADNLSVDFSGRHVVRVRFTTTSVQIDVDGVAGMPIALSSPISTTTRFRIGANVTGTAGNFFKGMVQQIAIPLPLTDAQAAQMLAFLNKAGRP